jgi:hypothetical protein
LDANRAEGGEAAAGPDTWRTSSQSQTSQGSCEKINNLTQRRQGAKTRKEQLVCFLCAFCAFAPLREMLLLIQGLFHSFKTMSAPPSGEVQSEILRSAPLRSE